MNNLYQLTRELESIEAFIDSLVADSDGEIPADVWDSFELLESEFERSADGIANLVRKKMDEADAMKRRAKVFAEYASKLEKSVGSMKNAIKRGMEATGKKKCGPFSVCNNGGKLPLELTDIVPEEYLVYEPKQDTEKIRKALDRGQQLPFAKLGERGTHIRMKA